MDRLTIGQRRLNCVVILDLVGKITLGGTNSQLRDTIRQLVNGGEKNVVLNLAAATHVDSSGLGEIVAGYSSLRRSDGCLKLANVSDRVMDLMTITKLYTVFEVYKTEVEAVESFDKSGGRITPRLVPDQSVAATKFLL